MELGKIEIDFEKLDNVIRNYVPSGRNVQNEKSKYTEEILGKFYCKDKLKNIDWLKKSLGTLGGGNHFIEVDVDEQGYKYLVIHTGSRNIGKQVEEIYQQMAIDDISGKSILEDDIKSAIVYLKSQGREKEISQAIKALKEQNEKKGLSVPKDLCYLTGEHREMYLHDMKLCQEFAKRNRFTIVTIIFDGMDFVQKTWFESIHNYIDHENNIVRKGAISAYKGQKVIIPMNMRDGCIVGIGKGNEDWNCSAPHGAGRVMSRSKARKSVTMEEYQDSMNGIYTTSVCKETIDESPMAYKPMKEIIKRISDTVEIEKIIKPIYNFKAAE